IAAPHDASTSRAPTGTPSQNRALSAMVSVHVRPPSGELHVAASAGWSRPSQSERSNVSYSWRNNTRSPGVTGDGAWAGSISPGAATVSVSGAAVESPGRSQALGGAIDRGGGTRNPGPGAPRGAQAAAVMSAPRRAQRGAVMGRGGLQLNTPESATCHCLATRVVYGSWPPPPRRAP